jgi:peroxiredoxin
MAAAAGESAPAFTLPDENGEQVRLPSGSAPLVLVFYRGDW